MQLEFSGLEYNKILLRGYINVNMFSHNYQAPLCAGGGATGQGPVSYYFLNTKSQKYKHGQLELV
jgi:hypothetical protein